MPRAPEPDLRERLREGFSLRGAENYADTSGWWADADLLRDIGPALAKLHGDGEPTLVAGVEALGFLLGPLVAVALGVGFVEIRKGLRLTSEISRTTPPDYKDRGLTLGLQRRLLSRSDRVLLVDEWIETGAQATASKLLIADAGSHYVGLASVS